MSRLFISAAALLAIIGLSGPIHAADKDDRSANDTPAAKKTRALLKHKVTCDYQDTPTGDVLDDLSDQVKGVKFITAKDGTIKLNHSFTFSAKNITLADALDKLLGPLDWGYVVVSQKGGAYDGIIKIEGGKERGYPAAKDK